MSDPGRPLPDPSTPDARVVGGGPAAVPSDVEPRAERAVDIAHGAVADRRPAASLVAGDVSQVLDAVADPVYVVDREWRFVYVNRSAAEAWQLDRDALLGQSLWSVHPRVLAGLPYQRLTEAMRERRPVVMESLSPSFGRWTEATVHPVGDGLLVYHRDVTRLRAAEEAERALAAERRARERAEELAVELTQAREVAETARRAAERAHAEAEAAARAKSDFLATMSHELRTPINAITGYTQLLELGVGGPVTDAQRGYLARLQTSGQHLLGLVDDVLDFAKIEGGRMVVARDLLDSTRMVAEALGIVAPQAAARAIRLVDATAAREDPVVHVGDEHRVRQILVNLLSNAVKFTAPGGTVTVRCEPVERAGVAMVALRVADTGVGIAAEHHARIFEPFVQVDGSRTRTAGGTGLGLAISRRLARLMGGDLTVESAPGEGSTFTLWLPGAPDAARPAGGAPSDAGGAATPAAPPVDALAAARPAAVSLAAVGARLRERLDEVLDAYMAHVRADPLLEPARHLSRAQLEDHALPFLADLVLSLLAIDESQGVESHLLRDGSAIQELIAFRHGEQRHRLGWTEDQLAREYDILATELELCARRRTADEPHDPAPALEVLRRLVDRAREASVRGHRHAARASAAGPGAGFSFGPA